MFALESVHIVDDAAHHDLHGLVVPGEKSPVDPFPVLGRDGPGFTGGMEDLPPELHVVGFAEGLLGVHGHQDVGPLDVDRGHKPGTALLGEFFPTSFEKIRRTRTWEYPDCCPCGAPSEHPCAAGREPCPARASIESAEKVSPDLHVHGAGFFALAAQRAFPRPVRVDRPPGSAPEPTMRMILRGSRPSTPDMGHALAQLPQVRHTSAHCGSARRRLSRGPTVLGSETAAGCCVIFTSFRIPRVNLSHKSKQETLRSFHGQRRARDAFPGIPSQDA